MEANSAASGIGWSAKAKAVAFLFAPLFISHGTDKGLAPLLPALQKSGIGFLGMLLILFFVGFATALLVQFVLAALLVGGRPKASDLGLTFGPRPLVAAVKGAGLALAAIAVVSLVMRACGAFVWQANPEFAWAAFGVTLVTYVLQASTEEVVHRGWALRCLREAFDLRVAALLVGLGFGMSHIPSALGKGIGPLGIALVVIGTGLHGVIFFMLTVRTGGIAAACGAHAVWNWAQSALFGFDYITAAQAVVQKGGAAPAWLTGGAWGPESSLVCIAIGFIGCAWYWFSHRDWHVAKIEND